MDFTRQLDIIAPKEIIYPITMIGCGGIGSPTAILLAKMGFSKITIIDGDTIEEHNLPNQFFRKSDLDKPKVEAMKEVVLEFTDCSVQTVLEYFTGQCPLSGIVVSGVDTMKTRKEIWSKVKFNVEIPLYVEGRTGGNLIEVYTTRPCQIDDIEFYERWLYDDEDAEELPCTARAIMYTGFGIAGIIASKIKKWIKKEAYYKRISLDFKTMTLVLQGLVTCSI